MGITPRQVVVGFGALRTGLGVAFLVAPRRLSRGDDVLMTRSFAVRELVLGLGGLTSADRDSAEWARLGALVDVGDVAASALAVRRRTPQAVPSLVAALGGLVAEAWAHHSAGRQDRQE